MNKTIDLVGNTIYYIHGYESSPSSTKALVFQKQLHARAIQYRDVPPEELVISDCLKRIDETICGDDRPYTPKSSAAFLA